MLRPIAEVLPHAGDMILLDRIDHYDAESIVCLRRIAPNHPFTDADGHLPSWAGIELMAQAIAAWSGCHARDMGQPVRLGFLLGSRMYDCNAEAFRSGSELRIEAKRTFHDEDGMGAFSCRIDAGAVRAEARLTVFSPSDPANFLASLA
ncbi:hotdog family protein [Dyella amyloliquefaciens]|uniref:hotdog family protein n=1 Tax=Dyella amyloliquefaciens TaxID=1770545 RepID=UPI001E54B514|nr:hotdog family protein [Dyella amyloliquefaciens]